jgi:DNA polymerase-4
LTNLDSVETLQLELPFTTAASLELDRAMDSIKARFGATSLTRAAMLGRDPGIAVPLLPD